jgi:hypothetical protein
MAKMYESDITRFIRELKQKNPHLDQAQKEARAIWWDKPQDQKTQQRNRESRVPQQAYVYQNKV